MTSQRGVNVKTSRPGAQSMCVLNSGASCDGLQANKTMYVFVELAQHH